MVSLKYLHDELFDNGVDIIVVNNTARTVCQVHKTTQLHCSQMQPLNQ